MTVSHQQNHHHRSSTTLKQQNKPFKGDSKNKTSRTMGKTEKLASLGSLAASQGKADRRNRAKMVQKTKREAILSQKRMFQGSNCIPKNIVIVPLCPDVDPLAPVKNWLDMKALENNCLPMETYYTCPRHKSKLRIVETAYGDNVVKIMQMTQIADFVIYLLSSEVEVDQWGENALRCIKANGAVSHITLIQQPKNDSDDDAMQVESEGARSKRKEESKERKHLMEVLKSVSSFMEHHFSVESHCGFVADAGDMWKALRQISEQRPKPISWREDRPYLIVDDVKLDDSNGILQITGFSRGSCNFSANRIVHLPQIGDFELDSITLAADPFKARASMITDHSSIMSSMQTEDIEPLITRNSMTAGQVIQRRDERFSEKLENSENIPDTFASEQTFPTEDELIAGDKRLEMILDEEADFCDRNYNTAKNQKKTVIVPRGTSSYQAAWMINDLEEQEENVDQEGQVANHQSSAELHESDAELEEIDMEGDSKNGDDDYKPINDEEERRIFEKYQKQRKQELQDAINFPDEVDTPLDIPARERFARFRALESFRTSRWDPYENLPSDYSKIYQFQNVSVSAARALEHSRDTGVEGSQRITLNIKIVGNGAMAYDKFDPKVIASSCPVVFGLLRHEHKTSVMHFRATLLKDLDTSNKPIIKSKDELVLWTGIRLMAVRPVLSECSRGTLHKMLRYVRGGETIVGSFFGPIQFESAPAILFQRDGETGVLNLIGFGNMMNPNPNRMIIKRTILSGHPVKVHRRSAVVRYMFFGPDDIAWFKPVELYTKIGRRRGHIKDSVGTHGYMKCIFDKPIQQQDTVCMALYKRVFPKWGCTRNFCLQQQ